MYLGRLVSSWNFPFLTLELASSVGLWFGSCSLLGSCPCLWSESDQIIAMDDPRLYGSHEHDG